MNAKEQGFLLLTSHMGDPQRHVLSVAQLRLLAQCVQASDIPHKDGELTEAEVMALGYNRPSAQRIVELLGEQERLDAYIKEGKRQDCIPISRVSDTYPLILRKRLGLDSSGCLWAKGDIALLNTPKLALVGSRQLNPANQAFAEEVGLQAAKQGITLVSGNARGADISAQEACLAAGGCVISVVADELERLPKRQRVLYLSEDSYDMPFSAQRALSRNRVIHALGRITLVAQCTYGAGGTWDGTVRNLRNHWSPVFCFNDRTEGIQALSQMGATLIGFDQLEDLTNLQPDARNFIDC